MKHSVKRGLCLLLVLAAILSLTACGGITGKYKLDKMEVDGELLDVSALAMFGLDTDDMYIELREDGTATLCIMDEVMEMCYADGQIWPVDQADEKVPFTVDGDTLTLKDEDNRMVFKK